MAARKKSDKLSTYRAKRKADRTPEPFGGNRSEALSQFVIQHHAARAVHYDLRLEMNGVLKSWAVPRGPSPNPADKRLAVRVEDHPLDYAGFEGRIPEGNYGAGAVIVWDRGAWVPIGNPDEGLDKGKLLFELKGYKLRGKWTLVKTKRGPKDWLLIKERDAYVSEDGTESYPADSILSGRTVEDLKANRDLTDTLATQLEEFGALKRRVRATKLKVMLAQPGKAFSKPGWLFEIKYDGYRLIAVKQNDQALLLSRNGNDFTASFPEIAESVAALPFEFLILDGETVVHDEQGIPNFSRLQKRGRLTRSIDIQRATVDLPASLYAFDLLAFDGYDLRPLKLEQRKHMLQQVLPTLGPVHYSDHISEHGEAMFEQMGAMGLEGVVGKRADSRYEAGRSSNWIKISVEKSDEFVVVGYTDPKIGKTGFGALLLGQYEDGVLVYSGRVGSGFKTQDLTVLGAELRDAEPATPPRDAPADKQMHWVAPECVCEVKYKEITPDGFPRHPVFLGLRDDKAPDECVRKIRAAPEPLSPVPAPVNKHVAFTNLDKVFWPAEGYTKGDLIDYYRGIAEWMLPYLQDRPVVLTRFPDGIDGKSFFQRDAPGFVPDWIRIETMWSENAEREVRYFIVDDAESLAYIANMGTIPLHVWSSRVATLEQPDWCILDLDPKEAPFEHVVKIAKAIRVLAEDIELPAFVKTSGSTGLHVLIPLGRQFTYEQCRSLGELLARVIVTELPEIATVTRSPARREGKVYVDYLQNGHGRLLVAPFSVRPLPGAPVSMPIRWPELNVRLSNERFHINNARRRMQSLKKHPLAELLALKPDLNAALQRLDERFG